MREDLRLNLALAVVSVIAIVAGILSASWVVTAAVAAVLVFLVAYREAARRQQRNDG